MTLHFNVTDALGSAPNHGITRTERRLAGALAAHPDVGFVVMHEARMWAAEPADVLRRLETDSSGGVPVVERFGIDPPPNQSRKRSLIASIRPVRAALHERKPAAEPLQLRAPRIGAADTLVSAGLDWVHGFHDAATHHVVGGGATFVGFCYDLIPIDHPEWMFPPDPMRFVRYYERLTDLADSILCISQQTLDDFRRHFPYDGHLRTIGLGSDAAVSTEPAHERFADSLFDGAPYAVYCATLDRRKNHQLLYRAMQRLSRRGDAGNMVFVGRQGSGVKDLIDALRHDESVAGRIAHLTNCDDSYLAAVYRRAQFAVYPSLYEGWGLGVTEALAHGTPCLVANGSSLGEAGLGVCRELHPLKTDEWVESMNEYFRAPPTVPPVALPTWEEAAQSLIDVVSS